MSLAVVPSGPDPSGPEPNGEKPCGIETQGAPAIGPRPGGVSHDTPAPSQPGHEGAEGAGSGWSDPPGMDSGARSSDETEPREIRPNLGASAQTLLPTARPTMEVFRAIFRALDAHARPVIGPAERELFAIPLHDHDGAITGGIWASTLFRWLNVELLFVPDDLRGRGVGSALLAAAETEAMRRGCLGAFVDTASFQAPGFYQRLGYTLYGRLGDFPPGHERLYFRKLFSPNA